MEVFVIEWTESECGWGSRPDGISVHFSEEQRHLYSEKVQNDLNEAYGSVIPNEYSYPASYYTAILVDADASPGILVKILKEETIRTFENNPSWLRRIT